MPGDPGLRCVDDDLEERANGLADRADGRADRAGLLSVRWLRAIDTSTPFGTLRPGQRKSLSGCASPGCGPL